MTRASSTPAVVLGEGLNALGVIRGLGRHGVPVHLVTTVADDLAAQSRFASQVRTVAADDLGTTQLLVELARGLDPKPVLIYTSDRTLQLVSAARGELARHFHIQVPPERAVRIALDKSEFATFVEEHGFPAPRTFAPRSLEEAQEVAAKARYPVVLKPALSFHWSGRGFKMRKATTPKSLVAAWKSLQTVTSDVLVQEYVDAPDDQHYAYYAYLSPNRGELAHVLVRKLRVYPIHAGVGSLLEVVRDPEMETVGRALLAKLEYVGVASVCFKRAAATGRPWIYEVNGRFPQCHAAFGLCGYEVPYLMYRDMIGQPLPAPAYRESDKKWVSLSLDISAFLQYRRNGELGVAAWLSSYGGVRTCVEFAWDDPLPLLALLRRIGRRLVVGWRGDKRRARA